MEYEAYGNVMVHGGLQICFYDSVFPGNFRLSSWGSFERGYREEEADELAKFHEYHIDR